MYDIYYDIKKESRLISIYFPNHILIVVNIFFAKITKI